MICQTGALFFGSPIIVQKLTKANNDLEYHTTEPNHPP